jgi:hypothetical protein
MHGLAVAVHYAVILAYFERKPIQVERRVSELIELSTRQNFAHWLAAGTNLRALMRSVLSWFSVKWKNEALPLATRSNDGFG